MLLKVGSTGEDVKKLQAKLGLTADGSFGVGTEKAVKAWQADHGLTADGLVGGGTWSKMFATETAAPAASQEAPELSTSDDADLNKLKGVIPAAVIAQIPAVMEKFNINTPLRLCHFLAQCSHESNDFKAVTENLNYSARALMGTFKKYFPTEQKAVEYERKPEKIANLVYANRMDNGSEASGDGFKYRGRGYIQLTGKVNYKAFGNAINEDIVSNPELVATKYPLLSAAWYWNSRNLNATADKGGTEAVVTEVTKKVNGGTIGLEDRLAHFKKYYSLIT
jgi:putative chitinase